MAPHRDVGLQAVDRRRSGLAQRPVVAWEFEPDLISERTTDGEEPAQEPLLRRRCDREPRAILADPLLRAVNDLPARLLGHSRFRRAV